MDTLLMISGVGFLVIFAVAFFAALPGLWREKKQRVQRDYINSLFVECWTGEEADRPYAWFRVIQHLRQWYPDAELIRMAETRREQSIRVKSDAWVVDRNGQLINTNGNSNDLEEA